MSDIGTQVKLTIEEMLSLPVAEEPVETNARDPGCFSVETFERVAKEVRDQISRRPVDHYVHPQYGSGPVQQMIQPSRTYTFQMQINSCPEAQDPVWLERAAEEVYREMVARFGDAIRREVFELGHFPVFCMPSRNGGLDRVYGRGDPEDGNR